MGSFIKKDLLVFWRDRKEVLLALLLPIGLILILNLVFSGLFAEESEPINIDVAIVQEDNESIGFEQFAEKVKEIDLPSLEKEALLVQARELSPTKLITDFLQNEEMKEWVNAVEKDKTEAIELVNDGELDAIITIPEGFTSSVLASILLGEDAKKSLTINVEEESNEVSALQGIVSNYVNTLNFQFGLGLSAATSPVIEPELPEGGREVVEGVEVFTLAQYFTIAMASLFALFISQTVAMKTVTEKRERVFNRILLTNSKPFNYLMGKIVATFLMVWFQLFTTFMITQLLLDVFPGKSMPFWIGIVIIITALAIAVSGLTVVFTSITLRLEDPNAVSGIAVMVIIGLATLGGSFFPIETFPEWIQRLGSLTPNGLTQNSILKWVQSGSIEELILPIMMLLGFFAICFLIGMLLFPRRERI